MGLCGQRDICGVWSPIEMGENCPITKAPDRRHPQHNFPFHGKQPAVTRGAGGVL